MDHLESPSNKSASDGLHYWAKLEGKSNTMSNDLLKNNGVDQISNPTRPQIALACGLTIYLALAIAVAAVCLRYCGATSLENGSWPERHYFQQPKYLTSVLKPVQQ